MLIENALAHYYEPVQEALHALLGGPGEPGTGQEGPSRPGEFAPGTALPALTAPVRNFFAVSDIAHRPMPSYRDKQLALLDLTGNPATMTTKTFASLLIVARAVRFIRDAGQRVTIITPSSANKAIALRDAVLRAITAGLVTSEELNVVVVVPATSAAKLRSSRLLTDPHLRARNPIAVYHGKDPGAVKAIARAVVDEHAPDLSTSANTNLWYTLRIENYLAADTVRALAEAEHFPPAPGVPRLHAHAVSSAYGLLGHSFGRTVLPHSLRSGSLPPRYFLVQHLGAPDMVLSLYHGSCDPSLAPPYAYDPSTGLYHQSRDQRFPQATFDPQENLDPTFYTRNPPTHERMTSLVQADGGGGIVVSLAECLERYGQVKALLGEAGVPLPADPRLLREWSLVMAVTGLLNAVDRGLVLEEDILVHGSGSYGADDFTPVPDDAVWPVVDGASLRDVVFKASAP
ncbi:DUF6002 family protein [Streptomyces sp. MMS24-I29]|uniref:DUF6002 family protein n=1 Tax=Streptomyces sp. MMS24-I29 TaxID=3351480 RepID=UPI003C7C5E90